MMYYQYGIAPPAPTNVDYYFYCTNYGIYHEMRGGKHEWWTIVKVKKIGTLDFGGTPPPFFWDLIHTFVLPSPYPILKDDQHY